MTDIDFNRQADVAHRGGDAIHPAPHPSPWPGPFPPPGPGGPSIAVRYSLEDWRAAAAELNACNGDESMERAVVLGRLMDEVRANARGGALPAQTRFVLALCDAYEARRRKALGYATVPELEALVGAE